jgi:hypothetical protein
MPDYRILVTGSRSWQDGARLSYELGLVIGAALREDHTQDSIVIVHGACPSGADAMADRIAGDYGWRTESHPANWRPGGVLDRSAGFKRNAEMVEAGADICLAFIRDGSHGASHCASLAEKAGIPVRRFTEGRDVTATLRGETAP